MLKTDAKKLETRDFISVGNFSLIYAVVAFVIGGVAQMPPVTFEEGSSLHSRCNRGDFAVCYGNVLDDVRILPGVRRDRGFYLRFR